MGKGQGMPIVVKLNNLNFYVRGSFSHKWCAFWFGKKILSISFLKFLILCPDPKSPAPLGGGAGDVRPETPTHLPLPPEGGGSPTLKRCLGVHFPHPSTTSVKPT